MNLNLNTNKPRPPRRRWWQFFTQFSLRTLLILVTLSACACWWWLQPGSHEELIGGGLKLRRQVRITGTQPAGQVVPGMPFVTETNNSEAILVNAGAWRLADENGDLLAAGRYDKAAAEGTWTLYHANGRKAASGRMLDDQRTGLWRMWDAEGRLVSEVTYRAAPARHPRPAQSFVHVQPALAASPAAATSLAPTGPGAPLLMFGCCCFCGSGPLPARVYLPPAEGGLRHGPARGWHSSGELQFIGAYEDDLRSGHWTIYDELGCEMEHGEYLANQRHGVWKLRDTATGRERTEEYCVGLPRADHELLMDQLREDLASGEIRRQVAAAQRLTELGPGGLPLLWESLDHPVKDVQLLALRSLLQLGAFHDPELEPARRERLDALASHDDPRLSARALLAIYLTQPERRDECFPRLLPCLAAAGERIDLAYVTLLAVYRADERHRTEAVRLILQRAAGRPMVSAIDGEQLILTPDELIEQGDGLIPHLAAVFESNHADTRLAVVHALRQIVAGGEKMETVQLAPNRWENRRAIPAAAQALVERAKTDRDARVKAAAEKIGREGPWGGLAGGGAGYFGGMSGNLGGF